MVFSLYGVFVWMSVPALFTYCAKNNDPVKVPDISTADGLHSAVECPPIHTPSEGEGVIGG